MSDAAHPGHTPAFSRLRELVRGINVAMLTTVAADGHLRSRPMATLALDEADASLWFFTADDTEKAREIVDQSAVGLSYAEPAKQDYVSLSGRAAIVRDPAKARELWTPFAKVWFPDGPDDPRLVLIRVTIEAAEYWDAPGGRMVQLYSRAKAAITGHLPEGFGEHAKVDLG